MNIYVAGKFEEAAAVRRVQALLREHHHKITHDWTDKDATGLVGRERHVYMARCAQDDLRGVISADAVVVLHHPRGCGMLVEVGMALAMQLGIIVIGARDEVGDYLPGSPIFYHLPQVLHADTAEDAVALIDNSEAL